MSTVSKIGYRNPTRSVSTVHDKGYPVRHVRPEIHDHLPLVLGGHVDKCAQEYNNIHSELGGKAATLSMWKDLRTPTSVMQHSLLAWSSGT